ncbi:MAG TPA: alkaline phosphatase family protein [Candidatus Acidoferrales bacterium]|jgi:phospholipase C|nr:alkaline phosphatase family protein [Candidatus Acidoferrales bacterium]
MHGRRCILQASLGAVLLCSACAIPSPPSPAVVPGRASLLPPVPASGSPGRKAIKHIIVVIQENRTLVNIFAGFPGADAPTFGYLHDGTKVALTPSTFDDRGSLPHGFLSAVYDWQNGAMNGFDVAAAGSGNSPRLPYRYLRRNLVAPYWDMATRYTLSDRMFQTEWGGSFTAHLDLIAGTTYLSPTVAEADFPNALPWGCDAPPGTTTVTVTYPSFERGIGPFPCFDQFRTMADTLDAAGISWKYYAPPVTPHNGWSSFDAIRRVRYGKDWHNVVSPETTIIADAASGNLPAVAWVVPDQRNSDHEGSKSSTGPSWVSAIVNTVGASKDWDSTAIFVLWDDWGGWYDDAAPPKGDYFGPGLRVPCIIISPYAKVHHVSHTVYEFGSILKFVENTFGLPTLGYTDAKASDMIDSFDFDHAPRPFVPIKAPLPARHFLNETPSLRAPDDD